MYNISFETTPRGETENAFVAGLLMAAAAGLSLLVTYRDEKVKGSAREIVPEILTRGKNGELAIKAWCELRNNWRMFLVDRIVSVQTGNPGKTNHKRETETERVARRVREGARERGLRVEGLTALTHNDAAGYPAYVEFRDENLETKITAVWAWLDNDTKEPVGLMYNVY